MDYGQTTTEKQSNFRNGAASLARQLVTHLREASGGLKSPQANRGQRQEMLQFRQSVHYEANAWKQLAPVWFILHRTKSVTISFLQVQFRFILRRNKNRDRPEVTDPPRTAERAHRRICFLLSIKCCQVELRVQIPSSGRRTRAVGRLLGCTQPMIKRPSTAIKYQQKQAWLALPNLTLGSGKRAQGCKSYRLLSLPASVAAVWELIRCRFGGGWWVMCFVGVWRGMFSGQSGSWGKWLCILSYGY